MSSSGSTPGGSPSMRKCATLAISPIVTEPCGPRTEPRSQRVSAGSHCSRCAPVWQSLSRSIRLARATAPPDMTMLREANVPQPDAVPPVSSYRGERHLLGPYHVFHAHLGRVAPDGARDLVDRALDREAGARPSDPAIGAERRLVGRDRIGAGAVVRDRVGAGQGAAGHVGFLVRPLRP